MSGKVSIERTCKDCAFNDCGVCRKINLAVSPLQYACSRFMTKAEWDAFVEQRKQERYRREEHRLNMLLTGLIISSTSTQMLMEYFDKEFTDASVERQWRQDQHNEVAADERIGVIEAFIRKPIPETWEQMGMKQRRDYFIFENCEGITSLVDGQQRKTITAVEVLVECFGQPMDDRTRYRTKEINQILRGISWLRDVGRRRNAVYGQQRTYEVLESHCDNKV